eukprot:CAMPEP_0194763556 /NCGR_PEP_ID=MMETSP0323_2-20130528/19816_1 /TAXON_ID=2866 ORGANISM="Crypthecodinium cohnii, Strain Seligo" /NCGR_SAMPLE_ID=MMETSP0323_2 /ASSEMBLY_ACC=CAM_ASM_000346 /LENGTH=37 /DNA_ID= /DNA_START= /DNA_END= /DNA_ORIENTATION=
MAARNLSEPDNNSLEGKLGAISNPSNKANEWLTGGWV